MTSAADRLHLYEHAKETWGERPARSLMELLPADPSQFATKDDVRVLGGELRSEMAELRGELRTEMAEFRGEIRAELHQAMAEQTRTLVLGSVGAIMTATALSFAASHLI